VLDMLHSERFLDTAPAEIHAILLDEGTYLCSQRTMYRVLERTGESVERRQRPPRQFTRPELIATAPNHVWTWDITKLKGPKTWTYFYLYTILDIYSRSIVGWMVAYKESAVLAEDLIAETCLRQHIARGQLTIHADHGSPMIAHSVAQLLDELGVTKTHSRPYVSNDNPFSESAFKTLKYRPDFPARFENLEQARAHCRAFVEWYNNVHRHCGIRMLTPATVHHGRAEQVLAARQETLRAAFGEHPERFVRGVPTVRPLPSAVYINPPLDPTELQRAVS
jgi:putative transposase